MTVAWINKVATRLDLPMSDANSGLNGKRKSIFGKANGDKQNEIERRKNEGDEKAKAREAIDVGVKGQSWPGRCSVIKKR